MNQATKVPRVVVGIITRDRASIVRKAIDSALAQNYPNLEVRVLDDGSRDETHEIKNEYPSVQWTTFPQSRGYVLQRNYLMREAPADYYASLDDDSWFLAGNEVQFAIDFFEANPETGAVGFDILSPDKTESQGREAARSAAVFIGCGHVLRMSAVRAAGEYAAAPGTYGGEEKDMALRLMDAGYRIVTLPGVHVWHDKTSVAREQPEQHRSGVCNDLAMTLRRTPLLALPLAMLTKLYRHFRFSYAHGLEEPFWEGLQLFFRSMPELWRTRRPVRLSTLRAFLKLTKNQSAFLPR